MAQSIEKQLAGKEAEVIRLLEKHSVDECMFLCGIKTRRVFYKWLTNHVLKWGDNMLPGLNGGTKHMWLRQHRELILNYLEIFGAEKTRIHFRLKPETLDSFLNPDYRPYNERLTPIERLKLENGDLRKRVEALEKFQERMEVFTEIIHEQRRAERQQIKNAENMCSNFLETITGAISDNLKQDIRSLVGNLFEPSAKPLRSLPTPQIETPHYIQKEKEQQN